MKVTLQDLLEHCESGNRIHEEFNFGTFNSEFPSTKIMENENDIIPNCGTGGCLAGELPAIDKDFRFDSNSVIWYKARRGVSISLLADYFGIQRTDAAHIFFPKCQEPKRFGGVMVTYYATLEEVLSNLRIYLALPK